MIFTIELNKIPDDAKVPGTQAVQFVDPGKDAVVPWVENKST